MADQQNNEAFVLPYAHKDHIAYMQGQLDEQIQITAYHGFAILDGTLVPYSLQKNSQQVNLGEVVFDLKDSSLSHLMSVIDAFNRLAFFQKVLELSKTEIAKQSGSEDMRPIHGKLLNDFLSLYNFDLETLGVGNEAQENPGKFFHQMVIGSGLFYMEDFLFCIKTVVHDQIINLPKEKVQQLRKLIHDASAVISTYRIGVSIFNEYHKAHLAHEKFLHAFEGLNFIVRYIALESDLKIEIEPDATVGFLIKNATKFYLDSEIQLEIHPELEHLVLGEKTAFDFFHIIFNLVNNAWKYSLHPDIKREFNVESRPIEVRVALEEEILNIEVTDYGLNINQDDFSKVLEGVQVHKSKQGFENIPSTGEGLRGVVDVISKMEGSIIIEKLEEGNGKKFVVKLPINDLLKIISVEA